MIYETDEDGVGEIMQNDPFIPVVPTVKHKVLTWQELTTNPKLLNAFTALMEAIKEL